MAVAIRGGVVSESPSEPCAWPTFDEDLRKAKYVVERARHATETMATGMVSEIRKHPLRASAIAMAAGIVCGALVGFGAGWFAFVRRT